jgi:Fibronectin type III-like domain
MPLRRDAGHRLHQRVVPTHNRHVAVAGVSDHRHQRAAVDTLPAPLDGDEARSLATLGQQLKAFQRVSLEPGETRRLRFEITAAARRYWSAADGAYVLDESTFDVWVGGASTAKLHAEFEVRGSAGQHTSAAAS